MSPETQNRGQASPRCQNCGAEEKRIGTTCRSCGHKHTIPEMLEIAGALLESGLARRSVRRQMAEASLGRARAVLESAPGVFESGSEGTRLATLMMVQDFGEPRALPPEVLAKEFDGSAPAVQAEIILNLVRSDSDEADEILADLRGRRIAPRIRGAFSDPFFRSETLPLSSGEVIAPEPPQSRGTDAVREPVESVESVDTFADGTDGQDPVIETEDDADGTDGQDPVIETGDDADGTDGQDPVIETGDIAAATSLPPELPPMPAEPDGEVVGRTEPTGGDEDGDTGPPVNAIEPPPIPEGTVDDGPLPEGRREEVTGEGRSGTDEDHPAPSNPLGWILAFVMVAGIGVVGSWFLWKYWQENHAAEEPPPADAAAIDTTQAPSLVEETPTEPRIEEPQTPESHILEFQVEASSQHRRYGPEHVVDGDPRTVWQEDKGIKPLGTSLELTFDGEVTITRIGILGGYDDPEGRYGDMWRLNNRLKKAEFEFSDGKVMFHTFEDEREFQHFDLQPPHRTEILVITVLDVYRGSWFYDNAIAEVEIWGYEEAVPAD